MSTVTKTAVEVTIGEYRYRAELDGNRIELFRDGASAGPATWNGGKIEGFPPQLSEDARDELTAAIAHNLGLAWRARVEAQPPGPGEPGQASPPPVAVDAPKTEDAANEGQTGNDVGQPARHVTPS